MWGEIPDIPTVVHGQPQDECSQTSRTMGTDPHNGAHECQQFQTDGGL